MKHEPCAVVEVLRGNAVESRHRVDVIVADADGAIHSVMGDEALRVYPRSSIKSLQALPLIESGAADKYGFQEKHLALACASHNGEPMHTDAAQEMLNLAGLTDICLECGSQVPYHAEDHAVLVKSGVEPSAIHNNCSGKHAGFLAFAKHSGLETRGYIGINHPVQQEIAGILEEVTGSRHSVENHGIDGCSIPTYRIPLKKLAVAYARFGAGRDQGRERSAAMLRLRDACLEHPEMVAGRGRVCTGLMQALGKRAFVKVGAEGVYSASLPELGFGIAMKAQDGNFRAVEVALSNLISKLLELDGEEITRLRPLINPVIKNRNNLDVGLIRMAE